MRGAKYLIVGIIISASMPVIAADIEFSGEGSLYCKGKHYYIHLEVKDPADSVELERLVDRNSFRIVEDWGPKERFKPSRADVEEYAGGKMGIKLVSARLKGTGRYRVIYIQDNGISTEFGPFEDPLNSESEREAGFFEKYIAPAFAKTGDGYRVDELSYGYDFSSEKTVSEFALHPYFGGERFSFDPYFKRDWTGVTAENGTGQHKEARSGGASLSLWLNQYGTGFWIKAKYEYERSVLLSGSTETNLYSQSLSFEAWMRLDDVARSINSPFDEHIAFKRIDLAAGYSAYESNNEDVWGTDDFDSGTPYLIGRFTCTLIDGIQISYAIETYWPSTLNDRYEQFQKVRVRLLLSNYLKKEKNRPYHPDIELAFDTGKRLPLFVEEKKVTLGFTFNLYPGND